MHLQTGQLVRVALHGVARGRVRRRSTGIFPSVAITVVVDAPVRDLVSRQRFYELVVSIDKASDPLVGLDILYVVQDLATQILAGVEASEYLRIIRHTLCLPIDQLKAIKQICGGNGGLCNSRSHVVLFSGEIKRLALTAATLAFL